MMSQHFRMRSELSGAIAKRLQNAKNAVSSNNLLQIYLYVAN